MPHKQYLRNSARCSNLTCSDDQPGIRICLGREVVLSGSPKQPDPFFVDSLVCRLYFISSFDTAVFSTKSPQQTFSATSLAHNTAKSHYGAFSSRAIGLIVTRSLLSEGIRANHTPLFQELHLCGFIKDFVLEPWSGLQTQSFFPDLNIESTRCRLLRPWSC
jgi:hypothetical protein